MEMTGEHRISAPREKVWEALNDPEVLAKCIPGCQELNKDSDTELSATVKSKVGPVSATFKGNVNLTDIDPPNGYTISGEGTGGAAGFAKGGARVTLSDDPEGTKLEYSVDATVGGKLAQIGSRLIDSTAKKMANDFFSKFAELVAASAEKSPATETLPETTVPTEETAAQANFSDEEKRGLSPMVWIAGVIVVALALVFGFQG